MNDSNLERYDEASMLEKEYRLQLFSPLIKQGTDKEHQFVGKDIYVDFRGIDVKWDKYKNDNYAVEVENGHHLEHREPSFINLSDDTLICYVKYNLIVYWTAKSWRQFIYTDVYKNRRTINVSGNGTTIKNFSLKEMPKPYLICRRMSGLMPLYEKTLRESKLSEEQLHSSI